MPKTLCYFYRPAEILHLALPTSYLCPSQASPVCRWCPTGAPFGTQLGRGRGLEGWGRAREGAATPDRRARRVVNRAMTRFHDGRAEFWARPGMPGWGRPVHPDGPAGVCGGPGEQAGARTKLLNS